MSLSGIGFKRIPVGSSATCACRENAGAIKAAKSSSEVWMNFTMAVFKKEAAGERIWSVGTNRNPPGEAIFARSRSAPPLCPCAFVRCETGVGSESGKWKERAPPLGRSILRHPGNISQEPRAKAKRFAPEVLPCLRKPIPLPSASRNPPIPYATKISQHHPIPSG